MRFATPITSAWRGRISWAAIRMMIHRCPWTTTSGDSFRRIASSSSIRVSISPMAQKRGRTLLKPLSDGLRGVGIEPASVKDVLITHMHYDHCGNHDLFPAARYHVQDREMKFATGRYMTHPVMRFPFDEDDVVAMVRRVFNGRVVFHDGDEEIAPGVSVHHVGGHTMGMQIVRVETRRGIVVLASDSSHLYANMEREIPYPIAYNIGEVMEGYRRARSGEFAGSYYSGA